MQVKYSGHQSLQGLFDPGIIANQFYDGGNRSGNMRGGINAMLGLPEGVTTNRSAYAINAESRNNNPDFYTRHMPTQPTTQRNTGGAPMAGLNPLQGRFVQTGNTAMDNAINKGLTSAMGQANALASYHSKDRSQGGSGEGVHNMGSSGPSIGSLIQRERSRLEGVQNPYGADYGKGLLGGYVSNINQGYAQGNTNLREQMAGRGLSQAGMSGIEAQGMQQNNLARTNAMVNARNFTDTTVREKAADFDMRRNQALDSFYQAQRSQDLQAARQAVDSFMAMAQNDRQQALHPYDVQAAQTKSRYLDPMLQQELATAQAQGKKYLADANFTEWMQTPSAQFGGKTPWEHYRQEEMNANIAGGAMGALGTLGGVVLPKAMDLAYNAYTQSQQPAPPTPGLGAPASGGPMPGYAPMPTSYGQPSVGLNWTPPSYSSNFDPYSQPTPQLFQGF